MQSLNRDEWIDRIKRQWNAELNQAKSRAPQDGNCKSNRFTSKFI